MAMLISGIQVMTTWLTSMGDWSEASATMLLSKIPLEWIVTAQSTYIKDPDLFGRVGRAWNHFVETGQIWAMIIGFILGYGIRAFTSFG